MALKQFVYIFLLLEIFHEIQTGDAAHGRYPILSFDLKMFGSQTDSLDKACLAASYWSAYKKRFGQMSVLAGKPSGQLLYDCLYISWIIKLFVSFLKDFPVCGENLMKKL